MTHPAVHIIDDDAATRTQLETLVESAGFKVACYPDAEQFLAVADSVCGCVLIDLRLPGLGGLELLQALRGRRAELGAIVVSGHGSIGAATRALRGGAVDFLTKPLDLEALLERIGEIITNYVEHQNTQAELGAIRDRLSRLTRRECQVMAAVIAGRSNKQIGRDLHISYRTVELHRAQVMDKMEADSIAEMVRQGLRVEAADESGMAD